MSHYNILVSTQLPASPHHHVSWCLLLFLKDITDWKQERIKCPSCVFNEVNLGEMIAEQMLNKWFWVKIYDRTGHPGRLFNSKRRKMGMGKKKPCCEYSRTVRKEATFGLASEAQSYNSMKFWKKNALFQSGCDLKRCFAITHEMISSGTCWL